MAARPKQSHLIYMLHHWSLQGKNTAIFVPLLLAAQYGVLQLKYFASILEMIYWRTFDLAARSSTENGAEAAVHASVGNLYCNIKSWINKTVAQAGSS